MTDTGPQSDNQTLFNTVAKYLGDMDLGSLFTVNTRTDNTGQQHTYPSGWLWDQITSGVDDQAALMISLEDTEPFKARYGVIADIRKQAREGKAVHVPTVAEVREYEQTVIGSLRQAGVPGFMYDSYSDAQDLMRKGLSAVEIEQRLGASWERVQNTDPMVRDTFNSYFGVNGDAALASMFLDPDKTLANLERMSRTAYTAGMGSRMGVNVDRATADRVAGLPKTDAGVYQDLTTIAGIQGSGILDETLGESQLDLNTGTAQDATFFGDGTAASELERRQIERRSQNAAVAGGALRTQKGLTGAGVAST